MNRKPLLEKRITAIKSAVPLTTDDGCQRTKIIDPLGGQYF
jgi:hypothetical protein